MIAAFLCRVLPVLVFTASLASAQQPTPMLTLPQRPQAEPVTAAEAGAPKAEKYVWSDCHVNGPYIAMTFDDGPSAKLTPHLLDVLKERNMHVTFFVLGENAKPHPEILKRALAEGHEIGNHSWDHPQLSKLSDDAVRSQLNRAKEAIQAANGGQPVTLMRPPYGALTKDQRKWVHEELGYKIILWDVDPLDWKRPGAAAVEERILAGTRNGSIILSHDIHPGTVEAMPDTFDKLLAKGFKFVTVSELLAMDQPVPEKPATAKGGAVGPTRSSPAATPRPTASNVPATITGAPAQ